MNTKIQELKDLIKAKANYQKTLKQNRKFSILINNCDIRRANNAPFNPQCIVNGILIANITAPEITLLIPKTLNNLNPPNNPAPTVLNALQMMIAPRYLKEEDSSG